MFGFEKKERDVSQVQVTRGGESEAPFRLEFAPGVILMDAEIRDRKSLAVFVNALQAMAALLPEAYPEPAKPALPEPPRNVTPPAEPTFATPSGFAPATAEQPGPVPTATPEDQPKLV